MIILDLYYCSNFIRVHESIYICSTCSPEGLCMCRSEAKFRYDPSGTADLIFEVGCLTGMYVTK